MLIILSIICGILLLGCVGLSFVAYKYAMIALDMEERLNESLDILDKAYMRMGEILERPLFYDNVEVRTVVQEIANVQNSMLYIANSIAGAGEEEQELDG